MTRSLAPALLGRTEQDARQMLGDLVFDDPAVDELVPAEHYLSGNVRARLEAVEALLDERPELARNAEALRSVLPADIPLDEIEPRMGAVWIDAETHQQFLREILGDPGLIVEHAGGSVWGVRGNRQSVAATSEWGTSRRSAPEIALAVLEQRTIVVHDRGPDDEQIFNATETAAAQDKASQMQDRFADWVWEEPDRARRLAREYNARFNSLVLRDYAAQGERLTLPGLVKTFEPRPHQRAAVARVLAEPATGLFHTVGAGKTAEMVIAATELRRLGLVNKPCVVVPNHMLDQFSREWLQLYPQARLLAASSSDLQADARRVFVAKCATHNWDAIVMTRSAFERLPLSPENERAFRERELAELESQLTAARAGAGLTVKRLEKTLQSRREKLRELQDRDVDPGITFEQTGIDHISVDEFHEYKNLATVSSIQGAEISGSKRATDMAGKIAYLRDRHGDHAVTVATATPIANSVTEAHVMLRYLRPDLLEQAGVANFDAWAATFGKVTSEIEMSPDGGSFRMKSRFASFINVPEMLRMWSVCGDVKTAEDLQLPRPALMLDATGVRAPQTVVIEPSDEVASLVASLAERAERVRGGAVDPREDNMLKISGDGRKAALDMRLVDGSVTDPEHTKLNVAAARIHSLWEQYRDVEYDDPQTLRPSPVRGALQLVFCDLGTPGAGWHVYGELRDLLVARGMPAEKIRFIHEAKNDVDKGRLFAAARAGDVAVLIGSTQKMGVGTNIQARAIALHHLDCPWRPADIEQREGRIVRQGNQNEEVGIFRYVVAGSFDGYSWQTVERKSRFIEQVMRGNVAIRTMDDIGDDTLSYAEVKALASGNPLVLEKASADAELQRLARLERAHQRQLALLKSTRQAALADELHCKKRAAQLSEAAARAVPTRGDAFAAVIDGERYTKRADAAKALQAAVRESMGRSWGATGPLEDVQIQIGGFEVLTERHNYAIGGPTLAFSIPGVPLPDLTSEVKGGSINGETALRRLESRVNDLEHACSKVLADAEAHRKTAESAAQQLSRPFKHAQALVEARARVEAVDRELAQQVIDTRSPWDHAQQRYAEEVVNLARLESALRALPVRELDRLEAIEAQLQAARDRQGCRADRPSSPYEQAVADTNDELIERYESSRAGVIRLLERGGGKDPSELIAQRAQTEAERAKSEATRQGLLGDIVRAAAGQPPEWITQRFGARPEEPGDQPRWCSAVELAVTAHLGFDPSRPLQSGPPQLAADAMPRVRELHVQLDRAAWKLGRSEPGTPGLER